MQLLNLLRDEGSRDNQALETDMMRFMAIIGVVFLIISALIKNIPLRTVETEPRMRQQTSEQASTSPEPEDAAQKDGKEQANPPPPPKQPGLHIEFHSLEDLLALLATQRVQLFGRAKATGFDLFFAGRPQGNTVNFTGTNSLPAKLWEIKSGKDHAFFLGLLMEAYPTIRTFPTRQVLVSFTDANLEERMEQTLSRLEQQGRSGIVSVTRTGELVFEDFASDRDVKEQSNENK